MLEMYILPHVFAAVCTLCLASTYVFPIQHYHVDILPKYQIVGRP